MCRASAKGVVLFAFDLIERKGENFRPRPFLGTLARLRL
jgi:hypothetical protein